jgi:hypothetical protein
MKSKTTNNFFAFSGIIILSATILIFNNSCQKEASIDPKQITASLGSSIIYTNVNPDSVIKSYATINPGSTNRAQIVSKNYDLDLNNDGTTDFVFQIYFRSAHGCTCANQDDVSVGPLVANSNQVANNNTYPSALDALAVIGSALSWSGAANQTLELYNSNGTTYGNWATAGFKYLGPKLIKGRNIYYGWIRLSVIAVVVGAKLTVMDYAYNSSPNQPILAGQTK